MSDWSAQAADAIENVVSLVRDRTVVPARSAAKTVVYGLFVAFVGLVLFVLAFIGLFRLVDVYLPGGVWATYFFFGGIFVIAGAFCWSRRNRVPTPTDL